MAVISFPPAIMSWVAPTRVLCAEMRWTMSALIPAARAMRLKICPTCAASSESPSMLRGNEWNPLPSCTPLRSTHTSTSASLSRAR